MSHTPGVFKKFPKAPLDLTGVEQLKERFFRAMRRKSAKISSSTDDAKLWEEAQRRVTKRKVR